MPRKVVTIAVLADYLGLAKGTVSRALNDYPDISTATKTRVARAALELGYVPNPTAQSLSRGAHAPQLHLVRPTTNLYALRRFYVEGLGLEVLSESTNHFGNEGLVVGAPQSLYQLEFKNTSRFSNEWMQGQVVSLVFFFSDFREWEEAVVRLKTASFAQIACPDLSSGAPGHTFEDPDGHNVSVRHSSKSMGSMCL